MKVIGKTADGKRIEFEIDSIYELKLHEKCFDNELVIIRVPGGWIYRSGIINQVTMPDGTWSENYLPSSVFVPWHEEFRVKE